MKTYLLNKTYKTRTQENTLTHYVKKYVSLKAGLGGLDAPSDWRPGGRGFNPRQGW